MTHTVQHGRFFLVFCFFFPHFLTANSLILHVRWNKARKRVHALPSFQNTQASQVSHTNWMHFTFSCRQKRTSCKHCNDLQLGSILHSLGRLTLYSARYVVPTLSGYIVKQKAKSCECASLLEIRNNCTQSNGLIQLWNWCEGRTMLSDRGLSSRGK